MPATDDFIERLKAREADAEQKLLNEILNRGYDQGCFLRPEEDDLVSVSAAEAESILEAAAEIDVANPDCEDPEITLEAQPVPGEGPGYVIISQQCDLLVGMAREPLVELARAYPIDPDAKEAQAIRINSARQLPLVETEGALWVADLRLKGLLPKDRLTDFDPVQIVPADRWDRFRMRLGQRYSRDALPTELVEKIQRPLVKKVIGRNATTRERAKVFTDWFAYPVEDKWRLMALIDLDYTQEQGDDAYEALAAHFPDEFDELLDDRSGATTMDKIDFRLWLTAKKLNLDEISWHPKRGEGHSEPTR